MSVAMQEIADVGMVPVGKSAPVETTINYHARTLFDLFSKVEGNNQTRAIIDIALSGLSCDMYERAEQEAIKMAAKADEAAGWTAKDNAKGAEKYGPQQASMRAKASMRRQIFGCARLNLGALVNIPASGVVNPDTYPGFVQAYNKARAYLHEHKLDWQGNNVDDKRRDRANQKERKLWQQARDTAEQQVKQEPGETISQWQARVVEHAQDILAELEDTAKEKALEERAQELFKEFGNSCLELSDMLRSLVEKANNQESK